MRKCTKFEGKCMHHYQLEVHRRKCQSNKYAKLEELWSKVWIGIAVSIVLFIFVPGVALATFKLVGEQLC